MEDKAVTKHIRVEVAYATPEKQVVVSLEAPVACSVADAIRLSGIQDKFPEMEIDPAAVGIYSRKVSLEQVLRDGDRVEIYRPLQADPKEVRRKRARQKPA
jgi:putative ubiquitin-RnfH superfamily antitoxin RatB of RatAB toxin-antitoxin module